MVFGAGDEDRVDTLDPLVRRVGGVTLTILMSTRHEPIASAVYRQNIGTVEDDDIRRARGVKEIRALPMNEYSGGGDS